MQISAEIRWFWVDPPPLGLPGWFIDRNGDICAAGGGKRDRIDEYLRDQKQVGLGIKRRGGGSSSKIEVKGLVVTRFGWLREHPFIGPIELWAKWTSKSLRIEPTDMVTVVKRRWLRKFNTESSALHEVALDCEENPKDGQSLPVKGCNVELTRVKILGHDGFWWTLGFEAFGTISTVGDDLHAVVTALSRRQPPRLDGGLLASYPAWLTKVLPIETSGSISISGEQ